MQKRIGQLLMVTSSLLFLLVGFQNCGKLGGTTAVETSSQSGSGSPVAQDMLDLTPSEITAPLNDATAPEIRQGQLPSSLTTSTYSSCTTTNQVSNSATVIDTIYTFDCPAIHVQGSMEIEITIASNGNTIHVTRDYNNTTDAGATVIGHRNVLIQLDASGNPASITSNFTRQVQSPKLDYSWSGNLSLTYAPGDGATVAAGSFALTDHGQLLGSFAITSVNAVFTGSEFSRGVFTYSNADQTKVYMIEALGSNMWHISLNGESVQPSGI